MTNKAKYDAIFIEVFEINLSDLTDDLEYQSIPSWDSVGHMSLMAELEDGFDVMLEMDDIVDFGSYKTGIETMKKYGVEF
jgi:acyl carrier protein|tara:strand:- start:329 stop:568 length:240 start_codon:yes stop_codon:yes gene_type:complete